MNKQLTIGMFDSGVGGLTVLREVKQCLPQHSFIYFGDTGRCPYGPKGESTIIRYSLESCAFLIDQGIDLLVVACNTASAIALNALQEAFDIPIIGMIEPAVRAVCESTTTARIGVIGTRATIASGVYQTQLYTHLPHAVVTAIACPLFVPLIEERFPHPIITQMIIHEYLHSFKEHKIDTLLLGCTHYALLQPLIEKELADTITVVNPAIPAAQIVRKISEEFKNDENIQDRKIKDKDSFFVSDDPERFRTIGEHFFGYPLPTIQCTQCSK